MMMNLFSIFDTSTNMKIELNWMSTFIIFFMLPYPFWFFNSRLTMMMMNFMSILNNELKIIFFNKFNSLNLLYFISMFLFILFNNFMGLFPYIFTSSSHLIFAMSMSLPMWISLFIFLWSNNMNYMFSHMIPQGTPPFLMPFMVLIETISNFIRPWTLAIRLTANMIAGHLLLTLLSQSAINPIFISIIIIMIQILLLILEFSVSIIQTYVFTILSSLYTKESNYE